ncbi:MAG: hypothetical protein ABI548_11190 [Polyangiaceae bacterium]
MSDRGEVCDRCAEREQEAQALRDLLNEQRNNHRRELDALQAAHDSERAKQDAEARDLAAQVEELLESLDD